MFSLLKLIPAKFTLTLDRYIIQWTGGSLVNRMFASSAGIEVQPALVLETTGRLSGRKRAVGLPYFELEGKRMLVGSLGGAPSDPAWVHNLRAHPEVRVNHNRRWYPAKARITEGAEHARLWPELVRIVPDYANYQKRCERTIPIVILEPQ